MSCRILPFLNNCLKTDYLFHQFWVEIIRKNMINSSTTQFPKGDHIMAEVAYCVKCKQKREMKDTEKVTMKNGRPAMKGTCTVCGTGMYKILPKGS
jgi:hypothetical protein